MSKSQLEMVKEFHVATQSPVLPYPGVPPHDRVRLRAKLVLEEALEFVAALYGISDEAIKAFTTTLCAEMESWEPRVNLAEVGKELNDLLYVTHGAILEFGLPEHMFDAVHANNMTKVGGETRADGKKLKPPGYKKFDAAKFLAENGLPN